MSVLAREQVTLSRVDDGESTINVVIESSAGNIFKNSNISAVLTCKVYRGTEDITSSCTSFSWSKKDKNGNPDQSWSRATTSNVISISSADVLSKAIFTCDVTIPD